MTRLIFVNLPVADLDRAIASYEAAGARRNERLSDATAICMVFSGTIPVMLLTHGRFRGFSPKPIADATTCAVLICTSAEGRAGVDEMTTRAGAAGDTLDPCPKVDHGFMYGRSFEDLDGHIWDVMGMDVEAAARFYVSLFPASRIDRVQKNMMSREE